MSTDEIIDFLQTKDIPEEFCKAFRGKTIYHGIYAYIRTSCICLNLLFAENYMDGTEFLDLTEEEVHSMVPPLGLAKKITRLIPFHQ